MRRIAAAALLLLLAGCDAQDRSATVGTADVADGAGARLERAARAAGLVDDPAGVDATGVYRSDTDSVCAVREGGRYRIGAVIDYGEGQGCTARGTATGRETLAVAFGDACRFEARIASGRIAFPATIPDACSRLCTGRASLAALSADRIGTSAAEARAMRAPDRSQPCEA